MTKKTKAILAVWLISIISTGLFMYSYAQGTITNATFEAGTQIETADYTIWREDSTYYAKNGSTGVIDYTSSNCSYVFQQCIDAGDDEWGLSIHLEAGFHIFTVPVQVDKPFKLTGNARFSTHIIADGIHGFEVGTDNVTDIEFGNVKSFYIAHLTIWGRQPLYNYASAIVNAYGHSDGNYSAGAGLMIYRGYRITVTDLSVILKESSINMTVPASGAVYKTVIDNFEQEYCWQGIISQGFVGVLEISSSRSYLTSREALNIAPRYCLRIDGWVSEADAWNASDFSGSACYISVGTIDDSGNAYLNDMHIQGGKSGVSSIARALLEIAVTDGCQLHFNRLTIQTCTYMAVYVTGGTPTGYRSALTISDFQFGTLQDSGYMGDNGTIGDYGFQSAANNVDIVLKNGWIHAYYGLTVTNENSFDMYRVYMNGTNNYQVGWSDSVVSAFMNNTGQFAHLLAGKPTSVIISWSNITYDGEVVVVAVDDVNTGISNIQVNVYWVNGTAITDPVIYVTAWSKYLG